MAVVKCRELRLVQTFNDREDRCVDESDVVVRVAVTYLANTLIVIGTQILNDIRSSVDIVEKCKKRRGSKALMDPVVDFNKN